MDTDVMVEYSHDDVPFVGISFRSNVNQSSHEFNLSLEEARELRKALDDALDALDAEERESNEKSGS